MDEKVWKVGCIWILMSSTSMASIANAVCTPAPDCASIGYTETSCEGDSLKCPFDITKLYCIPCDSSFKYDCSGNNITSSVGSACGGKYVACECYVGAIYNNGVCLCDDKCSVGSLYYSDGSCSSCVNPNKTFVGVVIKENEIIMNTVVKNSFWLPEYTNIEDIVDYATSELAKTDYMGYENTYAIVSRYGSDADMTHNVGVYCYNYTPIGYESSKNKWYLPAVGELYDYIYSNYNILKETYENKLNINPFAWYMWSSSERGSSYAWRVSASSGDINAYYMSGGAASQAMCFFKL